MMVKLAGRMGLGNFFTHIGPTAHHTVLEDAEGEGRFHVAYDSLTLKV
ncbi:MAG: hypothetical protein KIH01_05165 [Candidatus Freyarchaeota archaeon]|nr:hypothetical protein [Candidatus Jordarchaeia archaeon]